MCPATKKKEGQNVTVQNQLASDVIIELEVDSVSISLDSTMLNGYTIYASQPASETFIGYNNAYHKLDFFDLREEKFIKSIVLESEGPHAIQEVVSFTMGNRGEVVFITTQNILVSDSIGRVINKIPINAASANQLFIDNALYPFQSHNFSFNPKTEQVYCGNISYRYGQCDPKRFETPVLARIDLTTKEIVLLPVYYPEEFKDNSYGFLFEFGFCFSNDYNKIVYNFINSSSVYIGNLENQSTTVLKSESSYSRSIATSMTWEQCENVDKKMRHYIENPNFQKIRASVDEEFFFRLHSKEMIYERGADGKFPNLRTRKNYLTIYDSDFRLVKELELGGNLFIDCSFIGSKGLYSSPILDRSKVKEDELKFLLFKIKKI